jgi:hypothetical protein
MKLTGNQKKTLFLLKGKNKPINISSDFVYTIVNSGKSSDIIAFPLDGNSTYHKGLWINIE